MRILNPQCAVVTGEDTSGVKTTSESGCPHNLTASTTKGCAKEERQRPAGRGRPVLRAPTAEHRQILELSYDNSGAEIARKLKCSRQYVHWVLRRWDRLRPPRSPAPTPIQPPAHRAKIREIKDSIVAFRIPQSLASSLQHSRDVLGLGANASASQVARVIVCQFLNEQVKPEIETVIQSGS